MSQGQTTQSKPDNQPAGPSCSTCRFWDESQRCVRFPPAYLRREVFPFDPSSHVGRANAAVWLKTEPGEWCGEWQGRGGKKR